MSFSDRLKELRIQRGLSQKEFADLLHVSPSAVSHFENGTNLPKPTLMIEMMRILECDANYLYQDYLKQDMHQVFNTMERSLVEKFRCVDAHSRGLILTVLNLEYKNAVRTWMNKCRIPLTVYYPARKGHGYALKKEHKQIFALPTPLNLQADCGIKIMHERMRPTFNNGDIALVKKLKVHHNEIGLYEIDGCIQIMKLYQYRGKIKLIPLNISQKEIGVEKGLKYRCLGRVIGKLEGEYIDKCE